MYCLDLHSSYLALITTPFLNLLQLSSDPAQFQAADFLARENHVAYVASSCLLLQCRGAKEEGTKKCFPHTRTAAKPRGSPLPTRFFSEMGSSEILCEAKNGQNCFPIVKNYGLWKWSSSLHKGHHPVDPYSQWSSTIKRVFSLKTHICKKSHKKHIGRVIRAKKESRRRNNETCKTNVFQ